MDVEPPVEEPSDAGLVSDVYVGFRIEEQIKVGPEPAEKASEDSYSDFDADMAELTDAAECGFASFDQLTTARDYLNDPKLPTDKRSSVKAIYPNVLAAFEKWNGRLVDIYASDDLECYVGMTQPQPTSRFDRLVQRLNIFSTRPPAEAKFHLFYDLSKAGVDGAPLLARVDQLAKEAPRLLKGNELSACVDRLYSTATDLAAVLEPRTPAQGAPEQHTPGGPNTEAPDGDRNPDDSKKPEYNSGKRADLLAVIARELDELELRYLKTPARSLYFGGAVVGVGVATFVALFGLGYGLELMLVEMWLAGALGAMLSIIQRLNDDSLDVKYDVGPAAVALTGTLRPILGGFAGLLTLLLVLSRIIPLPVGTGADGIYLVVLAVVAGFAERSVPDILSKAQNSVDSVSSKSPAQGPRNPVSQSSN